MDTLPDEVMILIFAHASSFDLMTSFQYVCKRWHYIINTAGAVWRGDVTLKGLTEKVYGNKLCQALRKTPMLKYLQIGYPHPNILHEKLIHGTLVLEYIIPTADILDTIKDFNKEIEYLQIIDRFFATESLLSIISRPSFRKLSVILDRLCDRREKISDLRKIFHSIPNLDHACINFTQRIQFLFEKTRDSKWTVAYELKTDIIDEFS